MLNRTLQNINYNKKRQVEFQLNFSVSSAIIYFRIDCREEKTRDREKLRTGEKERYIFNGSR